MTLRRGEECIAATGERGIRYVPLYRRAIRGESIMDITRAQAEGQALGHARLNVKVCSIYSRGRPVLLLYLIVRRQLDHLDIGVLVIKHGPVPADLPVE